MSALPVEIERKYLLRALPAMPAARDVLEIDQGYLPGEQIVERLRRQRDQHGQMRYFRTIKLGSGVERIEVEEETDARTFEHLWLLTEGRRLRKRRYVVPVDRAIWEIDEFLDRALVLAEIELKKSNARVSIPDWISHVLVREVTTEKEYANRSLAR